MARKHTNNQMREKTNDLGQKFGNQENITKKPNGSIVWQIIRRARRPERGNTHRYTQNDTKKISNLKTPGHDGIHGFWFKEFTSIHEIIALERNRCIEGAHVPEWMTKGKTPLIQKLLLKKTVPNNYRPITCLLIMWKILTAKIREEIYYSLTSRGLIPEEQKGCCKGSRGTRELLFVDQHILKKSKTKQKNLPMARIDNKKAYFMFPPSRIINCLKMYKISHEVINFIPVSGISTRTMHQSTTPSLSQTIWPRWASW